MSSKDLKKDDMKKTKGGSSTGAKDEAFTNPDGSTEVSTKPGSGVDEVVTTNPDGTTSTSST